MSNWSKFWPILIISCSILAAIQVVLYLFAYIGLLRLFGGVLLLLLSIPLSYAVWYIQTKYQQAKSVQLMNKIAFILIGAFLAPVVTLFLGAFIVLVTGGASLVSYLGIWQSFFLVFIVAPIIGASITYLMGKRRDFMTYM